MKRFSLLLFSFSLLFFLSNQSSLNPKSFFGRLKNSVTKRLKEFAKGPENPGTPPELLIDLKKAEVFIEKLSQEADLDAIAEKENELKIYLTTLITGLIKSKHSLEIKNRIKQVILELRALKEVIDLAKGN